MTDQCRWITDQEMGRVFIPGCMGGAVYGEGGCTCKSYIRVTFEDEEAELEKRVEVLEKQMAKLQEQIRRLTKC